MTNQNETERTFQVRRFRNGGNGIGIQIASDVTLQEAAEIAFRFALLQDEHGGNGEFTILPL